MRNNTEKKIIQSTVPALTTLNKLLKSENSREREEALVIVMIKKISDDQLFETILKSYNIRDGFFLKYYSQLCLNNASDKQVNKLANILLNIFSTETNETVIISGMQNLMRLEPQQIKPLFVKYFKTGTIGLRRAAYVYLKNEKDGKLLNEVIAVLKADKSYEALKIINELENGKTGIRENKRS